VDIIVYRKSLSGRKGRRCFAPVITALCLLFAYDRQKPLINRYSGVASVSEFGDFPIGQAAAVEPWMPYFGAAVCKRLLGALPPACVFAGAGKAAPLGLADSIGPNWAARLRLGSILPHLPQVGRGASAFDLK
jgi:hypothetical protein